MIGLDSLPDIIAKIRACEDKREPITMMVGGYEVFRQSKEGERVPALDVEAMTKWIFDAALSRLKSANTIFMIQVGGDSIYRNCFGRIEQDDFILSNY